MFEIFNSVQSLVKLESVCVDNNVFRVHYKVTVVLLLACSALITGSQYFGSPINCTFEGPLEHIIDNYCWMNSYVTFPKSHELYVQTEFYTKAGIIRKDDRTVDIRQTHYQWIGAILFFQAILFFVPRFIWKYNLEDGKIKSLAKDITTLFPDPDKQLLKINLAINYMKGCLGQNNVYFFQFFFCEMLNLINVLVQIFLMDKFLDHAFTRYGYGFGVFEYANEIPESRSDPLSYIFPKVVKCTFKKGGHTLNDANFEAICALPGNIFNEKIAIFLWFWFNVVLIISILGLIYRLITIFSPQARAYILHRKFAIVNEDVFETSSQPGKIAEITDEEALTIITQRFNVADWFMLYQVGKNMDSLVFGNLVKDFVQRLKSETDRLRRRNGPQKLLHQDSLKGIDVSKPFLDGGSSKL